VLNVLETKLAQHKTITLCLINYAKFEVLYLMHTSTDADNFQ